MSKDRQAVRGWPDVDGIDEGGDKDIRAKFTTTGGRSLLRDDSEDGPSASMSGFDRPSSRSGPLPDGHGPYDQPPSSSRARLSPSQSLHLHPPPTREYRPHFPRSASSSSSTYPRIDPLHSPADGQPLGNPSAYRYTPRSSDGKPSIVPDRNRSRQVDHLAPLSEGPKRDRTGLAEREGSRVPFKSRRISTDQPLSIDGRVDRRELARSPVKSMDTASDTADHHPKTRSRDGDRRSISPSHKHPLPSSSIISPMTNYRGPSGPVGSFFNRPPSHHSQMPGRTEVFSPPPTGQAVDGSRYPIASRRDILPRVPSPVRRDHPRAWFKPGHLGHHRDTSDWSPNEAQAYDAGYADAMTAVENGIFGVNGVHYQYPILVRREMPLESVSPQHRLVDGDENALFPQVHTPLSSLPRPPHLSEAQRAITYPFPGVVRPALPPHPAVYDQYINHPSHPAYRGRQEIPYDAYNPSQQHMYSYHSILYPPNASRSQRQLISCYPCRNRKLKCDGQKPCAQCIRRGSESECAYASHVRRRGKGKKIEDGVDGGEGSSGESVMAERGKAGSMESLETPRSVMGHLSGDEDGMSNEGSLLREIGRGEENQMVSPPVSPLEVKVEEAMQH